MILNKLYPFSRNRYYKGKMLTTADFEAEQQYMNGKRRFINQMVLGTGVVNGFNVTSLDDTSILIESGFGIDTLGQEIILGESIVRKLSAIEGFEKTSTKDLMLCVRYKETPAQPIYAVNRDNSNNEYENNRIEEGYELFIMDTQDVEKNRIPETNFLTEDVLYSDTDYRVTLSIPHKLVAGAHAKMIVKATKVSEDDTILRYESVLQSPVFVTKDGIQEIKVELNNISLEMGQTMEQEYWFEVVPEVVKDSSIMLKAGSTIVESGNNTVASIDQLFIGLQVVDSNSDRISETELGKIKLESYMESITAEYLCLAEIKIVGSKYAYVIESVDERVKAYVQTNKENSRRQEYNDFYERRLPFYGSNGGSQASQVVQNNALSMAKDTGFAIESGVVEIPLGENARKGDICYSSEIMHGLGKGNVFVEIGYEFVEHSEALGKSAKSIVYGNTELFGEKEIKIQAETAVKVIPDKGSFVVAVKLLDNVRQLVLTYRWIAIRYESERMQDELEIIINKSISANTPTVVMGTKESYFFQVSFQNMKPCTISYELTEEESGEISPEGVYTAPAKEGVYEIKMYCTDMPIICTYAYAIVKKKSLLDVEKDITAEKNAAKSNPEAQTTTPSVPAGPEAIIDKLGNKQV